MKTELKLTAPLLLDRLQTLRRYCLIQLYLLKYFLICDSCGKTYKNNFEKDISCPFCKWKN